MTVAVIGFVGNIPRALLTMTDLLRRNPSSALETGSAERGLAWRLHLDMPLLLGLLVVSLAGLAVLYSASGEDLGEVIRQAVRLGAGFLAMIILAQVPPRSYHYWALPFYAFTLLLLVAVMLFGVEAGGARRWVQLPGLGRFQPSELMKLALPLMVAAYLSGRNLPPRVKHVVGALLLIIVPTVLIARQPDLGTALLVCLAGLIVLFFAGLSWRLISLAGLLTLIAAPLAYLFVLQPYQRRRIETLFNPEADPLGAGWNIIQSKIAIGSGGLFGKGWLNGTQSRLDFLPESSTDFILAVIGEEFGLVGILLLLAAYLFLITRGLYISWQTPETFSRLVGVSIAMIFLVYVIVNMAMASGLLPVVGIPLPLISYGGTSVVTLLAGFGILMSIRTHRRLLPPA